MQLQVVIVNYNVRHFLIQCLESLQKSTKGLECEIWVVDNNSVDDSLEAVGLRFPGVKIIANKENLGFSKANNQAIRLSESKYVLLLNPDTVVSENTLKVCVDKMDEDLKIGGLGLKMIDGSGTFLPESKRGLPTLWVALCKTMKLHKLLPNVAAVNKYYLGNLSEDENHEVDVLSGAFMFLRRSVLDEIGLLDEDFFMYGEDIDLSYRITKAGYKNFYSSDSQIIHYKGESTKKGSLNYILTFYNAMIIFARKHYQKSRAWMYILLIKLGILAHGTLSFIKSSLSKYLLFISDALAIYFGLYFITRLWGKYHFGSAGYYPEAVYTINLPLYTAIWLFSYWIGTAYDRKISSFKMLKSVAFWSIALLAVYALLDPNMRNSRVILLLGTVLVAAYGIVSRSVIHKWLTGKWNLAKTESRRILIIGSDAEGKRVQTILDNLAVQNEKIQLLVPEKDNVALGRLKEYCGIHGINEIIFCALDLRTTEITQWMSELGTGIAYKIIASNSASIVGSPSKNLPGELYTLDLQFQINSEENRRNKWLVDKGFSAVFLVLFIVLFWFSRRKTRYFQDSVAVLLGIKTWVSYQKEGTSTLPRLKDGIFTPARVEMVNDPKVIKSINLAYARDYTWLQDVERIWKSF